MLCSKKKLKFETKILIFRFNQKSLNDYNKKKSEIKTLIYRVNQKSLSNFVLNLSILK